MIKSILIALIMVMGINTGLVEKEGYKVGDVAMDFSLKNIDGSMVSMADYDDAKGFIVVFTCNHCPFAKAYEDRIIALDKKYKAKGYPVIAINPNDPEIKPEDSFENMKIRAREKGFTFPYLVDGTQEIARTYGATVTPHVFLLNKENGKLRVAYIGGIDSNARDESKAEEKYVEDAVEALLAGKSIPQTTTRATGCTIKWKNS